MSKYLTLRQLATMRVDHEDKIAEQEQTIRHLTEALKDAYIYFKSIANMARDEVSYQRLINKSDLAEQRTREALKEVK